MKVVSPLQKSTWITLLESSLIWVYKYNCKCIKPDTGQSLAEWGCRDQKKRQAGAGKEGKHAKWSN